MPKLYMLIGVPGSGKSTWYNKYREGNNNPHVLASTDFLIDLVAKLSNKTYDDVFKDTIKSAEKTMYELVSISVKNNADIIWDQTNLNRKTRAKKLIMIPDHYEKIAVFFPVPVDLYDRLKKRGDEEGKNIPIDIVRNMIDNLEYPQHDEGFTSIVTAGET